MAAGNDSTRSTYSGIMRSLLSDRDQLEIRLADPSLIAGAVEEGLRCYPAFAFIGRAATAEIELHGRRIKPGDRVLLWYRVSNRDPEVFTDPQRFDISRHNCSAHQAFGAGGRHFRLGAGAT